MSSKFLGVFVNSAHFQSEGIDQVLDKLQRTGAQAVAFVPFVEQPANPDEGSRFPHLHRDGYQRILARPVWGKTELNIKKTLSFEPNPQLYAETPYRPSYTKELLDRNFSPSTLVTKARERGLEVYLQLHPFLPPNLHDDDKPVFIDGRLPTPPRVANNATLTSPAAQAYAFALIEDALHNFPDVDGLFLDWAEFGAYQLQDHFACFSQHSQQAAIRMRYDWDRIGSDVRRLWDHLHHLDQEKLRYIAEVANSPSALMELLLHFPGWMDFLQFKAQVVREFFEGVHRLLERLGFGHKSLCVRGWPPPWNHTSGMDYRSLSHICSVVSPKLFLFDYSAMPRWYGQTLHGWNPDLSESEILDVLVAAMNLHDGQSKRRFADYNIPAPNQPHLADFAVYENRLRLLKQQIDGPAEFLPYAHAYLPTFQFEQMVELVRRHADGMWLQMYGYLSDEKLDLLQGLWL